MEPYALDDITHYSGISSLEHIATRDDRVCVLNIMGNESRIVTPISHAYSGGNVVFGTSAGRQGMALDTPCGAIPIYDNVGNAIRDGHTFNTGVVYLPPNAVRDGVAELVRVNPSIRKIIILTEKVPVRAAREIRSICHARSVDVFGANCLGVADSWNKVRIGGALGGDAPGEVLRKGSVAIFSNSGNFTNTIATYLSMAGWGTTTLISSGKDVYIHYGPREFAEGLANDARSKAAVLYVEPGGYYEQNLVFDKPIIACVVGKWKTNLSRAVGHAGALAGSGDDAGAKERWLLDSLDVPEIFTPENPVCSKRGAVVTNLSHIHVALNAVAAKNNIEPDFARQGGLELKPWFSNSAGLNLPSELDIKTVRAPEPYADQIDALKQQLGATFVRQSMKDKSGASRMDPQTLVTSIHGKSVLDLSRQRVEENIGRMLTKSDISRNEAQIVNTLVGVAAAFSSADACAAAELSERTGNAPNMVLASALGMIGPRTIEGVTDAVSHLLERVKPVLLSGESLQDFRVDASDAILFEDDEDERTRAIASAIKARALEVPLMDALQASGKPLSGDALLATLIITLGAPALSRKRISLQSVRNFAWMFHLLGAAVAASISAAGHPPDTLGSRLTEELGTGEMLHLALTGTHPDATDLQSTEILTGIILSNGPGTISAQGAKGAVSADGPEEPGRVQLNKAMIGFLTHSGFSHGGNGFECVELLLEQFKDTALRAANDPNHGLDLQKLARDFATTFKSEKAARKQAGQRARALPGVNHPVFRNKPVNTDPREAYISALLSERGQHNVFLESYKLLVRELHSAGVTRNVFCVNVDAVIACILLAAVWPSLREGTFSEPAIEKAAFNAFLFGRLIGSIAEIDDHVNRGRNMDTRTDISRSGFVA